MVFKMKKMGDEKDPIDNNPWKGLSTITTFEKGIPFPLLI